LCVFGNPYQVTKKTLKKSEITLDLLIFLLYTNQYMMKKDKNTMNLEVKSNLAKLLANENITIQHNNVKTASFDVKNRVLTLPIFKEKSGDVYDMLIAHECAHALWTPYEQWKGIDNAELRSYVNVLEDCRIDLLIQAKYPGVVRNYQNGFDILEKQNFFGISGKDINKEFMIIDKINLRSKSLQRLPFIFSSEDNSWLAKVDALKTFDDVLALANELLDWQKGQVEQMMKLPDFDNHIIAQNYDLADEDFDDEDFEDFDGGQGQNSDADSNDDDADEKNDFNNFGDQKADDEKDSNQSGQGDSKSDSKEEVKEDKEADRFAKGAGGADKMKMLKSITDDTFNQKQEELQDKKAKGFRYAKVPTPNLGKDGNLTSWKTFLSDMEKYKVKSITDYGNSTKSYVEYLDRTFKTFTKENKKTVMYLVKEFEMKKAATAYKRASTDKTGIIDPLKLPQYQYNEDIFKKLTIIPDGKNHGMMMLLDWSGSMSDVLFNTVKQLINLVEFCRKVNIPYEVYFFTSERSSAYNEDTTKGFSNKPGEWFFENFHLVNCLSHRMNKKQADLALKTLFHMGMYFDDRYTWNRRRMFDEQTADALAASNTYGIPSKYYLGNTPLNESLIYMDKLIPMFRKKYGIEKMTFITLTDGSGNSPRGKVVGSDKSEYDDEEYYKQKVYQMGKTKFVGEYNNFTEKLLEHIKKTHKVNVIGFYVVKRVKRWDIEKYINNYKDYSDKIAQYNKMRKELTRDKAIAVNADGYDKFFILDGKKLDVENLDMANVEVKKGTPSELKRIFGKSMANRLVSRVVLNKFIKEVA